MDGYDRNVISGRGAQREHRASRYQLRALRTSERQRPRGSSSCGGAVEHASRGGADILRRRTPTRRSSNVSELPLRGRGDRLRREQTHATNTQQKIVPVI